MKHFLTTITLLITLAFNCFSQNKDNKKPEELKFLVGQSILNLQFDYQGMTVGEKPEQLYIEEKRDTKKLQS